MLSRYRIPVDKFLLALLAVSHQSMDGHRILTSFFRLQKLRYGSGARLQLTTMPYSRMTGTVAVPSSAALLITSPKYYQNAPNPSLHIQQAIRHQQKPAILQRCAGRRCRGTLPMLIPAHVLLCYSLNNITDSPLPRISSGWSRVGLQVGRWLTMSLLESSRHVCASRGRLISPLRGDLCRAALEVQCPHFRVEENRGKLTEVGKIFSPLAESFMLSCVRKSFSDVCGRWWTTVTQTEARKTSSFAVYVSALACIHYR